MGQDWLRNMSVLETLARKIKKDHFVGSIYALFDFLTAFPPKDFLDREKIKLFWKVRSYTMVGFKRVNNVYELSRFIERIKLTGAFVECGVWRGGCAAVMACVANGSGSNRKTWLFDSFEGLPEPSEIDGNQAKRFASNRSSGKLESINECVACLQDVERLLFSELGIRSEIVIIQKGWFQDVLPQFRNKIGPIALLRLDGDWYESTKCCLENLYENVVPGGFVIIDDYGHWQGCKTAVDQFLHEKKIVVRLQEIDYTGRFFQKPGPLFHEPAAP